MSPRQQSEKSGQKSGRSEHRPGSWPLLDGLRAGQSGVRFSPHQSPDWRTGWKLGARKNVPAWGVERRQRTAQLAKERRGK